jgi:glycosyltransferase involved in cell wall biosynthesis
MKLLIVSFYFRPDLSAGSFRIAALVDALLAARPDVEIDVVTTLPNRYRSFSGEAPEVEQAPRLTVRRIALPSHKSGMADQARAFVSFARAARQHASGKHYNAVFASSSRLMTAALGAHLARGLNAPLYLDIRDIFVDTMKDVLPRFAFALTPLFGWIERRTIHRAQRVNLVSRGFGSYFEPRYPGTRFSWFTNGVDDEFISAHQPHASRTHDQPLRVLYAGNIGEGQGLHIILPDLARRLADRASFRILGDGGRCGALRQALDAAGVRNVEIHPPVGRPQLIQEYAAADVLFLHLNDYPAFHRVLPSKLFEYAATEKPVWAGMAGHAAAFAAAEIDNVALFAPGDAVAAVAAFDTLRIAPTDRSAFVAKYARATIMRAMAMDILAAADGAHGD